MKDFTDCPKCGKKTLVMRSADVYQCLSCDFKRDFSEAEKENHNYDFPALLVIVFITLVLFFIQSEAPAPQTSQQPTPYTVNLLP
ncbi:MAG: hypothetical protein AAFX78_06160 [Cyanobacteria bacterium J06638_20]